MSDVCQAMGNVSVTSVYISEATNPSSSELPSSDDTGKSVCLAIRRGVISGLRILRKFCGFEILKIW